MAVGAGERNSSFAARYLIPSNNGGKTVTDVRFYTPDEAAEKTLANWKELFVQDTTLKAEEQEEIIAGFNVSWLTLSGSFKGKTKDLPYCKFLGAVIRNTNGIVAVRLFGPRTQVDAATSDFKKMIHQALQEA